MKNTFGEIDTPALLLDADLLEANLRRMASFFAARPSRLRPHFKSHKCTRIARMQIAAGSTVGITCAKLGEAEMAAAAGIQNILIANQIVGPFKIGRLLNLARQLISCASHGALRAGDGKPAVPERAAVMVAADSEENVRRLSAGATAAGVTLGVLVEVDIGMNRCGVGPGRPAVELAGLIAHLPGLRFEGLQAYEGHIVDLRDETERTEKTRAALAVAVETRRAIEQSGIAVPRVTGGGTGTYTITGDYPGVDEVQAGSYAAMDWWYSDIRPEFGQAMSILTTIISRPSAEVAIVDVGRKGVGAEFGPPRVKGVPGATVARFGSEEHTAIGLPANSGLKVGDHLELIPSHGCTTSNLYREFVVHRRGIVQELWPIEGSGKMQ